MAAKKAMRTSSKRAQAVLKAMLPEIRREAHERARAELTWFLPDGETDYDDIWLTKQPERPWVELALMPRGTMFRPRQLDPLQAFPRVVFRAVVRCEPISYSDRSSATGKSTTLVKWVEWQRTG